LIPRLHALLKKHQVAQTAPVESSVPLAAVGHGIEN
jgi:hypothetical protein